MAYSQVKITPLNSKTDKVDMGICFVEDSLVTSFYVERTGVQNIRIKQTGSVITRFSENDPTQQQHEEFITIQSESVLDEGTPSDTIKITYKASDLLSLYPYGYREARLDIILFDAINDEIVSSVTYLLIARKAEYYIDNYNDILSLDSVYVDGYTRTKPLRIQNVQTEKLELFSTETEISSTEIFHEFSFQDLQLPIQLAAGDSIHWQVSYHPKDMKSDTALMIYSFRPEPVLFPDSTVTDTSLAVGFGVKNDFRIIASNYAYTNGDSLIIDIGNIPAHNTSSVEFTIDNNGNIPLGVLSEVFEFITNPVNLELFLDSDLNITKFIEINGHIQPRSVDSTKSHANIKIDIKPNNFGKFEFIYRVQTDLSERPIYGYSESDQYINIIIKGVALSPRILLESDTVNFGNVVTSSECPNFKTVEFNISNTGNDELYIWSLETGASIPFSVEPNELIISSGQSQTIEITFSPDDIRSYEDILTLNTVYQQFKESVEVKLFGNGIPRESSILSISQDIKAKPGSKISIPISVDKNNISYAKSFSSELKYNRSILYYTGFDEIRTASEGMSVSDITESSEGLFIELETLDTFANSDVLIYLNFDVYLGSSISTELIFTDAYFSDDICDNVLAIDIRNGIFTIDSVCGLNRKVYPKSNSIFSVIQTYPNPTEDIVKIDILFEKKSTIEILVYNSFGELVISKQEMELASGKSQIKMNLRNLSKGVYHISIRSGVYVQYIPVIVN